MAKIKFICSRPECETQGQREPSQIRNTDRLYCSRKCFGLDRRRWLRGEDEVAAAIIVSMNSCDVSDRTGASRLKIRRIKKERGLEYLGGKRYVHERYDTERYLAEIRDYRVCNLNKYIRDKDLLLPYSCECGNLGKWLGERMVLELDHISGDSSDNRLENLRWLCPNCHSQKPTSKGKKRRENSALV